MSASANHNDHPGKSAQFLVNYSAVRQRLSRFIYEACQETSVLPAGVSRVAMKGQENMLRPPREEPL